MQNWMLIVGELGLILSSLSCGRVRAIPEPQASPVLSKETQSGFSLGSQFEDIPRFDLNVVSEVDHRSDSRTDSQINLKTSRRPDFSPKARLDFKMISRIYLNTYQLSFKEPLTRLVQKTRDLFFIWPENFHEHFKDSKILQASVSRRVIDAHHSCSEILVQVPAEFDQKNRFWFVSISKLMALSQFFVLSPNRLSHEAETQVVFLDLLLSNQSKILVEIRFRLDSSFKL